MTKQFLFIFALYSAVSWAQPKKWTLEECVNFALKNNITIQQTTLDVDANAINKKAAFGSFLPNISSNASHSWNIGLNQNITTGLLENQTTQFSAAGLNANIIIYNGLQNQNRLRRANLAILASQYQLEKIQNDVSLNVANAFLQILFSKENLKVLTEQQANDEIQLNRTQELVNSGVVPRGDLLDAKATVAADVQRVIVAQNTLFIAKLSLAQLLQIADFQNFDITSDETNSFSKSVVLSEKPETILDKAKQERIELKIAKANLDVAQKDIKIARGAYQPTLAGFYSFSSRVSYTDRIAGFQLDATNPTQVIGQVQGTNQNVLQPNFSPVFGGPLPFFDQFSNNKGHNFGVQLNIPILNGFAAQNNVARSKIAYERAKIASKQAELDLERNVYNAINDAKGALNAFESAKVALDARTEAFTYAKERFAVGLINTFTLNQAQTLFTNAQSELIRTKFDYIFKTKVVEFYFGIPLSKKL